MARAATMFMATMLSLATVEVNKYIIRCRLDRLQLERRLRSELAVTTQQDAAAVAVRLPHALPDAPVHPASGGCHAPGQRRCSTRNL
jgi:hypothetical protein